MNTTPTEQAPLNKNKNNLYSGLVWIVSSLALIAYGLLIYFNSSVPGMEELMNFLTSLDAKYIYIGAFVSVVIEGLYFVGSFFPGASLLIILAILSQSAGWTVFITTLLLVFIGWTIAGAINIFIAKTYRSKIMKLSHIEEYEVRDHVWTTWFPAFRSSHEVAQVAEGGHVGKVFISSLRVRFWATLFLGALALIVPLFFNIKNASDKDSYISITIVAAISMMVGIAKVRRYFRQK